MGSSLFGDKVMLTDFLFKYSSTNGVKLHDIRCCY